MFDRAINSALYGLVTGGFRDSGLVCYNPNAHDNNQYQRPIKLSIPACVAFSAIQTLGGLALLWMAKKTVLPQQKMPILNRAVTVVSIVIYLRPLWQEDDSLSTNSLVTVRPIIFALLVTSLRNSGWKSANSLTLLSLTFYPPVINAAASLFNDEE